MTKNLKYLKKRNIAISIYSEETDHGTFYKALIENVGLLGAYAKSEQQAISNVLREFANSIEEYEGKW